MKHWPEITLVMVCAIWCHFYISKNMKNTHGGVLLLIKLQAKVFLNCKNSTKSRKVSHYFSLLGRVAVVL